MDMAIYMKVDGLKGPVTAEGFKDFIELQSAQLGVNRHVTSASGRGTNREASVPAVSEIVVTKNQDTSSTSLFKMSLFGEGKKSEIHFVKTSTDGKKNETYLKLELENVLITSYSLSAHGGDNHSSAMESLSLNFTKITYHTILQDDKNKAGTPERAMWDLATSKGG